MRHARHPLRALAYPPGTARRLSARQERDRAESPRGRSPGSPLQGNPRACGHRAVVRREALRDRPQPRLGASLERPKPHGRAARRDRGVPVAASAPHRREGGLDDEESEALGADLQAQRPELARMLAQGRTGPMLPALRSFLHLCGIRFNPRHRTRRRTPQRPSCALRCALSMGGWPGIRETPSRPLRRCPGRIRSTSWPRIYRRPPR